MSKIALITGASSGLGEDFAKALLKEGLIVYAAARRLEKMDELKELGAIPLKMDITKDEDILAVVARIQKDHGKIDVLINNAGFALFGAMEDISLEDARYQFEVNLFGMARLTQLVLPLMRTGGSGRIINISSMGGKIYTPLGSWYHATKHALEGWSDCLRLELAQFEIDVVLIEPGAIKTEFADMMVEPLLKHSGTGLYSKLARAVANVTKHLYSETGSGSDSSVITDLILKAVRAKKTKTRYVAGKYAKSMMFIRKWFGDRVFDWVVMSVGLLYRCP